MGGMWGMEGTFRGIRYAVLLSFVLRFVGKLMCERRFNGFILMSFKRISDI